MLPGTWRDPGPGEAAAGQENPEQPTTGAETELTDTFAKCH